MSDRNMVRLFAIKMSAVVTAFALAETAHQLMVN